MKSINGIACTNSFLQLINYFKLLEIFVQGVEDIKMKSYSKMKFKLRRLDKDDYGKSSTLHSACDFFYQFGNDTEGSEFTCLAVLYDM